MNRITILVAALVVAGCATTGKFEAKMNSFIGKPEVAVVGALGQPAGSYQGKDGSRVLTFTRSSQIVLPGAQTTTPVTSRSTGTVTLNQGMHQATGSYVQTSTTDVPQQGVPITAQFNCAVNFVIGPDGIVRSWSSFGNRCVAD